MAKRRRHTVCHVKYDGRDGHLHSATVRLPAKGRWTEKNLLRLAETKTGIKARGIFSLECARADRGRTMPRRRR